VWLWDSFFIVAGLFVLGVGGECLVQGASCLARGLGVSALVVGLTVVAFGTSAPEAAVSVTAGLNGRDSLAVANVVGSCILNVLLVLGCAASVRSMQVSRDVLRHDVPIMLLVLAIFVLFALDAHTLRRWQGLVLLAGLLVYILYTFRVARAEPPAIDAEYAAALPMPRSCAVSAVILLLGLAGLKYGADMIVFGAVNFAERVGVSERIIGLTLVALGTSLPELATSVVAARRGKPDIAIGNVVGSNIFNILAVLGLTATLTPLEIDARTLYRDVPVMLLVGVLSFWVMRTGHIISRAEGFSLLLLYLVYVVWTLVS